METTAVDNEAWLVTQQIGTFSPSVEQTFYNEDDAVSYCEIMRRNKPDRKYRVYRAVGCSLNPEPPKLV